MHAEHQLTEEHLVKTKVLTRDVASMLARGRKFAHQWVYGLPRLQEMPKVDQGRPDMKAPIDVVRKP